MSNLPPVAVLRSCSAPLADLVWPAHCVGCGATAGWLCGRCAARPPLSVGAVRAGPGRPVPVVAAAVYRGALATSVVAFKERGHRALAAALCRLLRGAVAALRADSGVGPLVVPPALVPVPTSTRLIRARGGDHALRLARGAAVPSGNVLSPLSLVRRTPDSVGQSAAQRRVSSRGAMSARPAPRGSPALVVVDDVVTTGSTLAEAVRALRASGWTVAGAATVAATESRRGAATRGRHTRSQVLH